MAWNYFECNFIEYKFYVLCMRMRFQSILNFLDTTSDDESEKHYNPNKEIRIKTSMLRWCDFNDGILLLKKLENINYKNEEQLQAI